MNKYGIFLLCLGAASTAGATTPLTQTDAEGNLSTGKKLYMIENYAGCIDQLSSIPESDAKSRIIEEAEFYLAMARQKRGEGVDALKAFVEKHPASPHAEVAWFTIGNDYYINNGSTYAITAYNNIGDNAFAGNQAADLTFRRSFCYLKLAEFNKAKAGFDKLRGNKNYGESSRFYNAFINYSTGNTREAETEFTKISKGSKFWDEAQFYIAQIRFEREDYTKALAHLKALDNKNFPKELKLEAFRISGESNYHLGNNDAAISDLNQYLTECDGTPARSALYIMGIAEYRAGNNDTAIKHLTDVIGDADNLTQSAYLYIGQAYLHQENMNGAAIAFEKAYKLDFDKDITETALYNYAIAKSNGGKVPFANSVTIFEDYLNRFPNSKNASKVEDYLINSYMIDKNYTDALATINKIKSPSAKMLRAKQEILYHLGISKLSNGQVKGAIADLTAAEKLAVHDKKIAAETQLWLGEAYYKNGQYAKSVAAYKKHLASTSRQKSNDALAYFGMGYAQFQQKKYSDAKTSFGKSLNGIEESLKGDAYNRIGDCLYYSRDYSGAESYYNKSLQAGASADYALFQKGFMQGLQRNHEQKIKTMDEVVAKYKNSVYAPKALYEKAQAYIALNDNASAKTTINKLMKSYSSSAEARNGQLQLAMLLNAEGNSAEAKKQYQNLIKKFPTSEEAKVAAEDLKVIYSDEGNLAGYSKFMKSIDTNFKMDENEADRLTFTSAENEFLNSGKTDRLKKYIESYPNGKYVGQAAYYVAERINGHEEDANALKYVNIALEAAPDASFAESALAIQADLYNKTGNTKKAKATYESLLEKATTDENKNTALLGLMRHYRDLGNSAKTIEYAEKLAGASLEKETKTEVAFSKAHAYKATGENAKAIAEYRKIASETNLMYGARGAYELAETYYEQGKLDSAESMLDKLAESGTPHQYWMARGFILLSDIYKKRGDKFQAREYLESLKENYPGTESDIFDMINTRLKAL